MIFKIYEGRIGKMHTNKHQKQGKEREELIMFSFFLGESNGFFL